MVNFSKKVKCVLCNSTNLEIVTDFPPTPIANQLFDERSTPAAGQEFVPLNLTLCQNCKHIQIDTLVEPTILFANYPYVSNSSATMAKRLKELANSYASRFNLRSSDFVIEIGSNDGYLLAHIEKSGCQVLGIDPAENATSIALASGIPTIVDFFSSDLALKISKNYSTPKLIIANNVLAHSDNLQDIFEGISNLMGPETATIIEFSYVVDVFEKLLFDTIYHEHTSYHSITPLIEFLGRFQLEIFDIERFDAHGGSARVYIKKIGATYKVSESVKSAVSNENSLGIHQLESWANFNQRISDLSRLINLEISEMKSRGETLIGYGVPAKFTSLFHILGLKENAFDFIVDDNPFKIGKYAPGTKIKITAPEDIPVADNIIIFSWNYSTSILEKIEKSRCARKRVLIPLPDFKVVELSESSHNQ